MTFEMEAILESKRAFRQRLAERPYVEKLRILDRLRERSVAFTASRVLVTGSKLRTTDGASRVTDGGM